MTTTTLRKKEIQQSMAELAAVAKLRKIDLPEVKPVANRGFLRFQNTYRHNPLAFVHDCIEWGEGEGPTHYQDHALAELPIRHRIAMYGPRGLGKSCLMSWLVWWALLTVNEVKVPITAGDWGQLEKYLWPEIHKWATRLKWDEKIHRKPPTDRELMTTDIRLSKLCLTRTASPQDEAKFEGAHAPERVMACFDEAKVVRPAMFDKVEGSFSLTEEPLALAFSTPDAPIGRFYDICMNRENRYSDWYTIHVTKEDQIKAGRLSPEFVAKRKQQWGESSALYQNHIEGNFAADATNTVIPWHYVLAAMDRWSELVASGAIYAMPTTAIACDPGAGGGDPTIVAYKGVGNTIKYLKSFDYKDTMQTANKLKEEAGYDKTLPIYLDVIGIGTGIYDYLSGDGYNVLPFNAAAAAEGTDTTGQIHFLNKRAEAWFQTRELLDPTKDTRVAIPNDDDLKGELTAPVWIATDRGKRKIQSKDELRQQLGRSTDHADAVIMALVGGAICQPYETRVESFDVDQRAMTFQPEAWSW